MSHLLVPRKKVISTMQNIKVVVRVRPLNLEESQRRIKPIVQCITSKEIQTKEKKYQFDNIFPPHSSQMDIYQDVVSPMIMDVLAGYTCTVFAYGQTGTGKTYTMIGSDPISHLHWKDDEFAGCIPRAAANIFDEIAAMDIIDYNVRVSFLELYNEEVRDLLGQEDQPATLSIFNDSKGSVYIQGLNEITVFNKSDIYALLQRGTRKRQTACTLMNNHSSRSHTVFTITVHTREATLTGEEVLKTGKINLVYLAGSENIAKSGAKDKRAVELANINKSLLSLGRVIQILAERNNKHVPFRDSKLTRILQDSLGGHTKTCIVATVSPSHLSYEETVNTLEYASRARVIKNTPTINEKVTKAQMLKEMTNEIEKLKKDLDAARQGEGFFFARENWEQVNMERQNATQVINLKNGIIEDMKGTIKNLEIIRENKAKQFDVIMTDCAKKKMVINKAKEFIKEQKLNLKQEQYVSKCYTDVASETISEAKELLEVTTQLSGNQNILQQKLETQYFNSYRNEQIIKDKSASLATNLYNTSLKVENLKHDVRSIVNGICQELGYVQETAKNSFDCVKRSVETLKTNTSHCLTELSEKHSSLVQDSLKQYSAATADFERKTNDTLFLADKLKKETNQRKRVANVLDTVRAEIVKQKSEQEQILQNVHMFTHTTETCILNLDNILNIIDKSKEHDTENHTNNYVDFVSEQALAEKSKVKDHYENIVKLESLRQTCEEKTCEATRVNITEIDTLLNNNINSTINSAENACSSLEATIESQSNEIRNLLKITNNTLSKDLLEKIVPVQRGGDTPKQSSFSYPKKIREGPPPREVLINRFNDEFDEDIENESFLLNCSAYSE